METELSPDKEKPVKDIPPVPIKTYQWEDLRRAREIGAYPWTHLLKAPLVGEVTAEDIIRETTPRRSMSREFSKSRTQSPIDKNSQRILNLDSSPGSSRRHGEEGDDEGVHIPNFSKEVSLDSEEDILNQPTKDPDINLGTYLTAPLDVPKNLSPKSILKRRIPEQQYLGATETREKTKCCHPLVNKIKHLADKTLHKLDRNDNEKSPVSKRKKNDESQEIRNLKSSPGAVRRQKFSAIKLGDSDEMSKTLNMDTPPPRKKKEHIYEDIEESKVFEEKSIHFSPEIDTCLSKKTDDGSGASSNKDTESIVEKKSIASQDPSLVIDDASSLTTEEHVMEKLHILNKIAKDAILLDEEMDPDEPNVDEIFENQLEERPPHNDSPNITITEILEDDIEEPGISSSAIPIESSPSPNPNEDNMEFPEREWSKPNSDHEYEIIEKPSSNIIYPASSVDEKPTFLKADDEFSSTTSLERKYLQHTSDEDEQIEDKENEPERKSNENILNAEVLQKDIEDRYFVSTPSTISRTECEVSTSQVDSSALENLPLKRSSRSKPSDGIDSKIQQRIKEGTGKLKTQAGKLKSKLQNIKTKQFTMPDKPKISMPDRPKFKMPERPKISFPDRPKFTMPDKRKFSLPDRPKFKKINISEKLTFGDKKKFTLPERPKFNVPDFPKFKMPEKPKINFPSLGRKKASNESEAAGSGAPKSVDFETRTYPRLFNRKKKSELSKTSSSPTLNREDTPPPTFTFTRVKKVTETTKYIPDSPDQPREYGTIDKDNDYENENEEHFNTTYDFDKLTTDYMHDESEKINDRHTASISESPSKQEYTHINEINNDEFFVRPRGISRENIQVREYLSDEIRQAFQIPKNVLALMGSNQGVNDDVHYANEPEADPELMLGDDNEHMRYETDDLNDRDDGYYTFPPIRPSRAKRKKKEQEAMDYIDDNVNTSIQFSEVDLELQDENAETQDFHEYDNEERFGETPPNEEPTPTSELHAIHDYANDEIIEYRRNLPTESQTLPMPPRRRKKYGKKEFSHSSINDFTNLSSQHLNQFEDQPQGKQDDVIVYRTEHEYTVPQAESMVTEQSPVPPRRNRSRSSRGTSLCDDDRTSHGAESLTLDTHITPAENMHLEKEYRHESPGYATVDKGPVPKKSVRRSKSKTPPVRRRKSSSSERKYYTVGPSKPVIPDRPPRKKSSASLMTLDNYAKCDASQYIEMDEPRLDDLQKDLQSGEIVNKMKDRPLPPPPRPPRGPKRKTRGSEGQIMFENEQDFEKESYFEHSQVDSKSDDVLEIEVSTQTDPLPDDIDFELGMEDNLDVSMSSSLRDIVDEESVIMKGQQTLAEIPRTSRAASRSEKSLKLSDPKISDLSKASIGRTSPTVILVEKRVSSPTRINECDQILTEASLTVQHIDIDESQIPDVPPLPRSTRSIAPAVQSSKNIVPANEDLAVGRVSDTNRNIHLDNLVAQRLQVRDLDVSRLNVSELQASKIIVSDIEGMSLQVTELDSKSGHISVSGIEFSQSVIDEIVKKFAEITTNMAPNQHSHETTDFSRPVSREEHTQTDALIPQEDKIENKEIAGDQHSHPQNIDDNATPPPQRPPPPDLTPLLYSYLQDISLPPAPSYQPRSFRERHFTDFHEQQHQSPAPPTRRIKRKLIAPHSGSSSEEDRPRPSPRRAPVPGRAHEPTITEAGAQFLRVCQNSISRTLRNMFNSLMSYISGTEDKKDVQMALVIFLVLIAGLIMFGLSDSKTIHHHHWEFFNPPDGKQ